MSHFVWGFGEGCFDFASGEPLFPDSCGPCPIFHFVNGSSVAPAGAAGIVEQGHVDMVNIDRQYAQHAADFVTQMATAKTPFLLYCEFQCGLSHGQRTRVAY